ncbi:hypothetical protein FQN54_002080 [Arachnomyces sp. PD_36]|nr:hypothetical protein FQN54_002080 [Arachnomyces sp. PD_36]
MRPLLSLPTPLLLLLPLITTSTATATSNESILRRNAEIEDKIFNQQQPVAAVKKMTEDEGEKFFLEYWYFEDIASSSGNGSSVPFSLPFPLHSDSRGLFGRYFNLPRHLPLSKRGFECPTGTNSCDSINRPNSCCAQGQTCQIITDTGLGDVGCCASGEDCEGGVSECEEGYTSCPNNPGGGCCIPGYECRGEGCVVVRTETVTLTPTQTTTKETAASETGAETTTSESETTTTEDTTQTIAPPIRPTTNPPPTTITSNPTSSLPPVCPTGFYACSAVYQGGCCRTGRDCETTSCPTPSPSTTIVNENGQTIVVPVGEGVVAPTATGKCAEGWFGCGVERGGGCCPEGFGCEERSCTATGSGAPTGEVGKIAVEEGGVGRVGVGGMWWWVVGGLIMGFSM